MKIRPGFVSNSSSSSFIIALSKKPETAEELQGVLFKSQKKFSHPYERYKLDTIDIAKTVFKDVITAGKTTLNMMISELNTGSVCSGPSYNEYVIPYWGTDKYDEQQIKYDKDCIEFLQNFVSNNENKEFYIVEYGDDSEYECALEHGDIFENIPHIRISKH